MSADSVGAYAVSFWSGMVWSGMVLSCVDGRLGGRGRCGDREWVDAEPSYLNRKASQ
ncbi:hypothetical protein GCM10008959_15890 [Deinococcus seoulensis]|uniref:Uncharacterized protein n=1 Tax=Deinococcus seoulensis TaxID=1837379 RepID=A0ABQ2RSF3_9DEIO|nr:hypothetical protein GCM10008959_15890 [Deinococcus seoulensis]